MSLTIKPKFISQDMTTDIELSEKQSLSGKNQPNGYAGLDAQGKILSSQLPALSDTVEVIDGGNPSSLYLTESIDGGNP